MNKFAWLFLLMVTALAGGCSKSDTGEASPATVSSLPEQSGDIVKLQNQVPLITANDAHSFARPEEARVTAMELDLTVHFDHQELHGKAILDIVRKPGVKRLILDSRKLQIEQIELVSAAGNTPLQYKLGEDDPNLGQAIQIDLPNSEDTLLKVAVTYTTSPKASGLQWLSAAQTAGKKQPFLFTQSQAIHARSWLPLQDTPAVRMTYKATVHTPPDLRAVMSAANATTSDKNPDGVYTFEMPQAIPSYLIALGVGDLTFVPMSPRTGIFAEPALAKAAAAEFADTEKMLQISEKLFGPYRWGRYDLLILPPSFPFGGMENPRLSFITPTVIAGDKSLVSLIAHELAHSWSGNLITNATWRDLWLNEGFTSFLTMRIMEATYGKPRADMEYYLDFQGLQEELADLPADDQILAIDLKGRDPDDVFSSVPYTKGQMFLSWLENAFGREKFDSFMREYFDTFSFQSITTEQFMTYLKTNLLDKYPGHVDYNQVQAWVFEAGLPDTSMVPTSDAFTKIEASTDDWLEGKIQLQDLPTAQWSVHEWLYFLNNLPDELSPKQLKNLDMTFNLTNSTNNEIAHSWLLRVIQQDYQPGFARLERYLVGIGRRKLIVPLYEELVKTPKHKEFAERVYRIARPGYHPLAQGTVDKVLAES